MPKPILADAAVQTAQFDERLAYGVDEAVRISGLSRSLLYQQMQSGKLPFVKVGKRTLIRRSAIDTFLLSLERAGTAA